MTTCATIALAALLLEDADLLSPLVLQDRNAYRSAIDKRNAELGVLALANADNFTYRNGVSSAAVRVAVYKKDISLLDGKLASLGLDRGFHQEKRPSKESYARNASSFLATPLEEF